VNPRIFAVAASVAVLVAGGLGLYVLMRPASPSSAPIADARSENEPTAAAAGSASPSEPARADAEASRPRGPRRATGEPAPAPEANPVAPSEAAPEVGTLRFESDVPGAQVFLDRQFVGTAPVTAENVKPGTHQLNVSAEGFDGFARTIDVVPGTRDVTVRFREIRLDASLPVVHKHRMGSCTGTLTATAQGLRYQTDDADDRFTASLGDLETFVVDYQDKNLRVKIRRGKQFNFTDPDGSADRLFVFHRDVDRARQRLAKGDQPASK
jgi:hypothetical protein